MFNNWQKTHSKELVLSGLIVGSLAMAGCASRGGILGVDCCADIPAGAVPRPAGTQLCDWQRSQVSGALADQTVLYQADFIGTSADLSPGAIDRMARNASTGLAAMQPSFIEPSGDVSLDASRVNTVNIQLASLGIASPMVEVATPAALGLQGLQAENVARQSGAMGNGNGGVGAPILQPSGFGGQGFGGQGFGGQGGNLPGGVF